MERVNILGLTVNEALSIPPLDRCSVIAGSRGLSREINSVNSFDAPDVMSWLKPGELVLTSGYVFDHSFNLVELVEELAKRNCSGLAIKVSKLPAEMLETANKLNLPIIEIPDNISISDLLVPILRQLFIYQGQQHDQDKKNVFIKQLIHREIKNGDAIFAEGGTLSFNLTKAYACLCITPSLFSSKFKIDLVHLFEKINKIGKELGYQPFIGEFERMTIIILQASCSLDESLPYQFAFKIKEEISYIVNKEFLESPLRIGIGTYKISILHFFQSYDEACQAIKIGSKISPNQTIYDYASYQTYAVLQYTPQQVTENFIRTTLGPLIEYDKESNSNLIKTLDVYLEKCLSPAETARELGVHRNTIHFRLAKIKELLGTSLNDGNILFQLNLASRMLSLSNSSSRK